MCFVCGEDLKIVELESAFHGSILIKLLLNALLFVHLSISQISDNVCVAFNYFTKAYMLSISNFTMCHLKSDV